MAAGLIARKECYGYREILADIGLSLKALILGIVIFGMIYMPSFVTRRHKRYSELELLKVSSDFSGIKRKYWGWAIFLVLLMLITVYCFGGLGRLYPEFELKLRISSGLLAVSYVPMYQSLFALLTKVYPLSRWEDFVISETPPIRTLAWRGMTFVCGLLAVALIYVFVLWDLL